MEGLKHPRMLLHIPLFKKQHYGKPGDFICNMSTHSAD